MDAKVVWEVNVAGSDKFGASKVNGDNVASEPGASCQEVLQAVMLLKKHVGELDDPFSCRFEEMLGSFGRKTQALGVRRMEDAKISAYFTHK